MVKFMCVLVVEDNALIRMILVEELRDAGYNVQESETADQAMRLLETIDPPLTILVTDVHMPGMRNGIQLAAHVRTTCPGVPVIYTTGRPDALRQFTRLDDQQVLVRKPYLPSEILHRIEMLLGR